MKRFVLILTLVCITISIVGCTSSVNLPDPGGYAVGRMKFDFASPTRNELVGPSTEKRQVIFEIFYPANVDADAKPAPYNATFRPRAKEATDLYLKTMYLDKLVNLDTVRTHTFIDAEPLQGTWPTLIFSPDSAVPYGLYIHLIETLVSTGYVVVALEDPYHVQVAVTNSGRIIEQAPGVFINGATTVEKEAILVQQRMGDIAEVLDLLTQWNADHHDFAGRFDLSRTGIIGHSFGGKIALLNNSTELFQAAVSLDGFLMNAGASTRVTPEVFDQKNPLLMLFSEEMTTPNQANWANNGPAINKLLNNSTADIFGWVIQGTKHMAFTDTGYFAPYMFQEMVVGKQQLHHFDAMTTHTIISFFDRYLKDLPETFVDLKPEAWKEFMPIPYIKQSSYPELDGQPIAEVTVYGTIETNPEVIRRLIRFEPGQPFQSAQLSLAEERLREFNSLANICLVPQPIDTGVKVAVYIQERDRWAFPLGTVMADVSGNRSSITYFNAGGQMLNVTGIWGFNERAENSRNYERTAQLQGALLARLPVNSTLTLSTHESYRNIQWGDYSGEYLIHRTLLALQNKMLIAPKTHLQLNLSFTNDHVAWTTTTPELTGAHNYLKISTAYDRFSPATDHVGLNDYTVQSEVGILVDLADAEKNYPYLTVHGKKTIPLNKKLVLALHGGAGIADPYTPLNHQFVLGDTATFSAYPLGVIGERYLFMSTELRYFWLEDLQIAVIFDGGVVLQNGEPFNFDDPLFCVGGTLRYRAPLDTVIELGYSLDPTGERKRVIFSTTVDF